MDTIWTFVNSLKTTWAVIPTSQSSIDKILRYIDWDTIQTIVEFWPGLWWFTTYILGHCRTDATLTCFEINKEDFGARLNRIEDDRLTIHYTSCEHIRQFIEDNSVDLIISTIPLSLIGRETSLSIITESHITLKPGWIFVTGQYVSFCKPLLQQVFWSVDHTRHLHNIPPLQIMKAIKIKEIDNR